MLYICLVNILTFEFPQEINRDKCAIRNVCKKAYEKSSLAFYQIDDIWHQLKVLRFNLHIKCRVLFKEIKNGK